MRLLNFANFEMPAVFQRFWDRDGNGQPPANSPGETRHADDLLCYPRVQFHNPDALHFPNMMLPTIPGNQNVTMGTAMVEYSHQPQWDRSAVDQAGPVRRFFQGVLFDNRVKHL